MIPESGREGVRVADSRARAFPWASLVVVTVAVGCIEGSSDGVSGPARCDRATPDAVGCAILYGTVTNTQEVPLDGIEGSVRVGPACSCREATLQVDDRGVFSVTVYRVRTSDVIPPTDTSTGTIVVLATAAKYPRHVTGAPYFDTARVVMRFVPTGSAPVPLQVRLRIPLPASGS